MKAKNKEMLNQMMNELREEMEMLVDPKDRFDAKAKYTELLFKISTIKIDIESEGKESIKEDIAKNNDEKENENIEDISEEVEYENEIEEEENEDPLDESEEVIYVKDEEGNPIDVTEIYNELNMIEDKEEREQAALCIKEQDCMEEYKSLDMLSHSDDKLYLAFCIKECGLEVVNEYVSELSSDMFDDVYEFINDNNLEGFTQFMSNDSDEEDDE